MLHLRGVNKSEYHSSFIFDKEQSFFADFRNFLYTIMSWEERSNQQVSGFGCPIDEHGEYDQDKEEAIDTWVDRCYSFNTNDYVVDVVFGKEKVFVMIFSFTDRQEEISAKMQKFLDF